MSNTVIQILRSYANTAPLTLNDGEIAYSFVSNTLFIGNTTNAVIAIAGNTFISSVQAGVDSSQNAYASAAFSKANTGSTTGEAAFAKANVANTTAESAYAWANTINVFTQSAFSKANIANTTAEAGFAKANVANTTAEAGFAKANVANTTAEAGFAKANVANTTAEAGFAKANAANVLAQAAFDNSNTKFASAGGAISGDVTVTGNLTVIGTTVYSNTETVLIKDNIITLNAAISQSSAPTANAGIEIDRGLQANTFLLWDETNDKWVFSDGNTWFGIADAARLDSAFTKANTANTTAEAGFAKANVANTTAEAGFAKANVANTTAEAGFAKANLANTLAQSVYDFANNISVSLSGNTIVLGSNTVGQLVSNAVTLTTATSITNGLSLLNNVLGKLVPAAPTTFPGATGLSISSLSTYRMTDFVQTDRTTTGGKSRSGGNTVTSIRRASSYTTNVFADLGPGDTGTLTLYKNNVASGAVTFTNSSANGTNGDLIITDSVDYSVKSGGAAGFWRSFDCQGSGTTSNGWNEIYLQHSQGTANTATVSWYYDDTTSVAPIFAQAFITPVTESLTYSSTVPHYNSSTTFRLGSTVAKLSGDTFPTTNTFYTGTAGGAFAAPASNTYPTVGITYPLARNLYVTSGNVWTNTTTTTIAGFGSSATGPSVTVDNSYQTASQAFTTALANTVLYKTGTASSMEETTITFGSTVGTGSGLAARIINPGTTDNPTQSASASLFNSQSSTLTSNDATIVAATLKHDQTNYSTGYLPAGPNLSTGRTGNQYFTFKFVRTSLSKFDIQFTGTIAGLWVAVPGSAIDTAASATNGWVSMATAYGGAGVPSSGCALGGVVTLNSAVTAHRKTCTFGTVSTSDTGTNEVYVRIKLTSGQTVTALSLQTASN